LNSGFTSAAKALGWSPTVITYNSATPGQALQQAINEGFKYIASTSITLSEITPQVQEAKAKGIALFEGYVADTPQGASNGLYGVVADQASSIAGGKLMGDWIEANSKGHANVVYVDLPLYPSLVSEGQGAQEALLKLCPSCTFSTLPVTVNQLGAGQVPSAIVSYLQAHPSVNYVYLSFQDLDPGLVSALRTAGLLSKVKVIGTQGQAAQLQEVQNGTEAMWSVIPEPYEMWVIVDWMARQSEGVLNQAALSAGNAQEVFFVSTPSEAKAQIASNGGNWPGPTNYEADYKTLWHV
jgi:ribose transport system substrate-binding protein